jgi:hypothetical protein
VGGNLNFLFLVFKHGLPGFLNGQVPGSTAAGNGKPDHDKKKDQNRNNDKIHSPFYAEPV